MEYRQVQRRTAKKLYNEGKTIYLLPCKCNIGNMWVQLYELSNNDDESWDIVLNYYTYYNCNCELGRYAHFYIKLD